METQKSPNFGVNAEMLRGGIEKQGHSFHASQNLNACIPQSLDYMVGRSTRPDSPDMPIDLLEEEAHEFVSSVLRPAPPAKRLRSKIRSMSRG